MRGKLTGFVIAALAALVPTFALASNQQVAEQIAHKLRYSGQMSDYKVAVKYQDGTAWLSGRVASEEQMQTALRLTFKIACVDRVVNDLAVAGDEASQPEEDESLDAPPLPAEEKIGLHAPGAATQAERVPSSYRQASVRQVAALEPEQMPAFQQPRSMATRSRAEARTAMMQANVRGPRPMNGPPLPMYAATACRSGAAPARYDQPCMPNYAWPSYAAYPNYAAVTYPKQYSPTAWPYIGPFYPYPQVPLGWRKVTLEWDSGWWFLDFKDQPASCWHR